MQNMFSSHNGTKLEINNRKKYYKYYIYMNFKHTFE